MESEWGENCITFGLVGTGATLCARWLFDPNVLITNQDYVWAVGIGVSYALPDMAHAEYEAFTQFGEPQVGFPYGIPIM